MQCGTYHRSGIHVCSKPNNSDVDSESQPLLTLYRSCTRHRNLTINISLARVYCYIRLDVAYILLLARALCI